MAIFGIEFGAPPPENFDRLNDFYAYGAEAPAPHSGFASYFCFSTAEHGVAKIGGRSNPFLNDEYGERARAAFEAIEAQLVRKYGTPEKLDFLRIDSIWSEPRDWSNSIRHEERVLATYWLLDKIALPAPLKSIAIDITSDGDDPILQIVYESLSWPVIMQRMQDQQADVL